MRNRLLIGALSVIGVALSLTGCTNPSGLDSIAVSPSTQSLGVGQTTQLSVTGTYGNASHLSTKPISSGVTWASNTPSVATVDASGVVTGVGAGTSTVTATASGFNGAGHVGSHDYGGLDQRRYGRGRNGRCSCLDRCHSEFASCFGVNQTTQFIAIGTTSTGATLYLTNSRGVEFKQHRKWARSALTTGLATAVGAGIDDDHSALHQSRPLARW